MEWSLRFAAYESGEKRHHFFEVLQPVKQTPALPYSAKEPLCDMKADPISSGYTQNTTKRDDRFVEVI